MRSLSRRSGAPSADRSQCSRPATAIKRKHQAGVDGVAHMNTPTQLAGAHLTTMNPPHISPLHLLSHTSGRRRGRLASWCTREVSSPVAEMARESEEDAMLDAALAFLDEWDLDVGGNGLRALATPKGGASSSSSSRWTSEEDMAVVARVLAGSPDNDDADCSESSSGPHLLADEDPTNLTQTRARMKHKAMDPRALALQTVKLRVKRRRHREELLDLRESVQVLERQLADLKVSKYRGVDHAAATAAVRSHSALGRIWERLAERQLKERERVEAENRELKGMIDEHVKLVRSLERILRKRTKSQVCKFCSAHSHHTELLN